MGTGNLNHLARNTGFLYTRMFAAMAVGLYTSRVLLKELGHEDFGIFFLIASILATVGVLQAALTGATQRFIAFELGTSKSTRLSEIFTTCLVANCIVSIAILIAAETVGIWILREHLNISALKIESATTSFHFATAAIITSSLYTPISAAILAYERMGIYASLGIIDITLKLLAAFAISHIEAEPIITYSALLTSISLIAAILHIAYFKRQFPEIKITTPTISKQTKDIVQFAIWNIWGNLASTLNTQGTNILISAFFGPAVSASRTISFQANTAINNFIQNVQAALNPQIIKLHASGQTESMLQLVCTSARLNYLLLLILAAPTITYSQEILQFWLSNQPKYAADFLRLLLISSLIDSLSNPLMTAAHASGKIKKYQITISTVILLNIPISYFLLHLGNEPQVVFFTNIALAIAALTARLIIVKQLTNLKISDFIRSAIFRIAPTTGATIIGTYFAHLLYQNEIINSIQSISLTIIHTITMSWIIGTNQEEKRYLTSKLQTAISIRKNQTKNDIK